MSMWRKKSYKWTTAINYHLKVTCHNWPPIKCGYSGKQELKKKIEMALYLLPVAHSTLVLFFNWLLSVLPNLVLSLLVYKFPFVEI